MKKKEKTTRENGIEMFEKKENEWSPYSTGMIQEKEDERGEKEKEEEKKEEEYSSTDQLLPFAAIPIPPQKMTEVEKRILDNPSNEARITLVNEGERKKKEEEEKKKNEEEKKKQEEEEKKIIEEKIKGWSPLGDSTSSLTSLVDGMSCFPPFSNEVVCSLDNVLNEAKIRHKKFNYEKRVEECKKMIVQLCDVCEYLLELGEEREKYLVGFGALGVVQNVEKDYVVICDRNLLENPGEEGNERFNERLGRWKAPEILSREEEKEGEKSVVFTMGMMCFTLIMGEEPFKEDCDEVANWKILMGERPDLKELEEKKCGFVPIM
jgi:hypothetical protein